MKKILAIALCAVMMMGITGCGGKSLEDKLSKELEYYDFDDNTTVMFSKMYGESPFEEGIFIRYYRDDTDQKNNKNYEINYIRYSGSGFFIYPSDFNLVYFSLEDVLNIDSKGDEEYPFLYIRGETKLAYNIKEKKIYYDFDIDSEDEVKKNLFCEEDANTCVLGADKDLKQLTARIDKNVNKIYKLITDTLEKCDLQMADLDATYEELSK